jgi:hypothetical protein
MGVRVMHDVHANIACLYDSCTGRPIGRVFDSGDDDQYERAIRFTEWLKQVVGDHRDIRQIDDELLDKLRAEFARQCERAGELDPGYRHRHALPEVPTFEYDGHRWRIAVGGVDDTDKVLLEPVGWPEHSTEEHRELPVAHLLAEGVVERDEAIILRRRAGGHKL